MVETPTLPYDCQRLSRAYTSKISLDLRYRGLKGRNLSSSLFGQNTCFQDQVRAYPPIVTKEIARTRLTIGANGRRNSVKRDRLATGIITTKKRSSAYINFS